ncbi:hypothetical protein OIO90_005504 [Microbotryomycetes sp. JL221]|nr:hypothetical protein OIO90_005504 [Microbotryomycetes sp. JL221]
MATRTMTPRPPPQARQSDLTRRTSFPDDLADQHILNKLHRWIWCFALVDFDLDTGPILDNLYPNVNLPSTAKANIAFSSLPEGELPSSRTLSYSWRIPMSSATTRRTATTNVTTKGQQCDSVPPGGDGYLHGYVYFIQEKDERIRRGFAQRSLVLISHLPSLPGLFETALSVIGPLFFKHKQGGGGTIEAACHNIANWPGPTAGSSLELPLLGSVLSLPASVPLTPLSTALHGTLSFSRILLLWELVLLGEPILISAPDSRTGADLVHHFRNLIRPIPFAGDYRPFFHIHDTDYSSIANNSKPAPGTIIATTNPLVVSSCKHWSNIVRTSLVKTDDANVVAGLTSPRKRHIQKDSKVSKSVDKSFKSGDYLGCDAIIFQHLAHLTELFLAPLNRFFGTLSTGDKSLSSPTTSRSFTIDNFITSLTSYGTPLPFRSTPTSIATPLSVQQRFYTKFLTSPNFGLWLMERSNLEHEEERKRYLNRLEMTDLNLWWQEKQRGTNEVDDLVERLEKEAVLSEGSSELTKTASNERSQRLRSQAARLRTLRDSRSRSTSVDSFKDGGRASVAASEAGTGFVAQAMSSTATLTSAVDSDDFDAASF